jgi:ketosteroid isomerase-like protein
MSQDNVELVQRCVTALQRGDWTAVIELLSPDVELMLASAGVGDAFHGHEGFRQWVAVADEALADTEVEVHDALDAGDEVVARVRLRARGRSSGIETAIDYGALFTVAQGRIVRYREFASWRAALEAVGPLE